MSLGLLGVAGGCGRGKPIEAAPTTPPAATAIWHDPSPHAVKFVTVAQGVRIEVLDWGGTGEPLVFLNGLGNTAHIFDDFAPRFTDRFHVLALTRRGWGASSHPPQSYSIPVLVDDVHAVLDSLHIARADFAGHSIAGQELTWLAAEYPARVGRLVYLDAAFDYHTHPAPEGFPDPPAPGPADSASPGAALAYTRRMSNVATPEGDFRATERFSPAGRFLGDATPPAISDSVYRSAKATAPPFVRVHGPVLAIYNYPETVQQFLPWIAPTDTSRATWLGAIQSWYHVQQENLVHAVPQAKVIVLPGAGHYVFLGQPDSVASAMRTFLLAPSQ
ncbi:MAG: alpha/beta fold hydrolase [Gemmatimonadales bacterium]|jgi:pimeloyl-ACP methyl ester carboxylesterase